MEVYLDTIKTAFFFFPLLAFFITLPYLIIQYQKYGSIPPLRSVIVYTFVLYLVCAFFLVILPLPSKEEVLHMSKKDPQLIPFSFLFDIFQNVDFNWRHPASYVAFLKSPSVYTVLFNLVLTLPFGMYLSYYFNKKWYQTLFLTFFLSLFFELTQLTGIYGIYKRAYRLFDVDDLIINTLGGMLGFVITPLFTRFLPSRRKLDETSYKRGKTVSIYRRAVAFFLDGIFFLCFFCLFLLFASASDIKYFLLFSTFIYYILLPLLNGGKTLGKKIVKIKVSVSTVKCAGFFLFLRQIVLYWLLLPAPFWIIYFSTYSTNNLLLSFSFKLLSLLLFGYLLYFYFELLLNLIGKKKNFHYERFTKTKNESTIL